ncbi:hypothetical protein SAMN05216599_102429 [Pseudomonas cichorii]|nr:hypothetical protein SAMN05216599_102429 [Pseudomonas cichorii]
MQTALQVVQAGCFKTKTAAHKRIPDNGVHTFIGKGLERVYAVFLCVFLGE